MVVGNCVTYNVAQELMQTGIDGILVGVGPGAACTTREGTGVGIPQVTATLECAAAREDYFRRTGRYVSVITDGGLRTGGDVCQGHSQRRRRRDAGHPLRPSGRGAGPRLQLGNGQRPS